MWNFSSENSNWLTFRLFIQLFATKRYKYPLEIYCSTAVTKGKIEVLEAYGGTVRIHGEDGVEAEVKARQTAKVTSIYLSSQIFNAARQQSHIETAPEKSGLVWSWLETVSTHNSCADYLAWSTICMKAKVCKFQNLKFGQKKSASVRVYYQCNLTLAQSCHQTGRAVKGNKKNHQPFHPVKGISSSSSSHQQQAYNLLSSTPTAPLRVIQPWIFRRHG